MEVKNDWYRVIEDIIQCPVCLKVTDSSYIHCVRGHHMCSYCVKMIKQCPMCNDYFMPKLINHLVANDLSSRLGEIQLSIFDDIKSSITKSQQDQSVQTDLLITNSSVNTQTDETKLLVATKSVHTQTSDDYFHSPNNSNWRKKIVNKTHSYPCLICGDYFQTYEKLEEHLQEKHEEDIEVQLCTENESILFNELSRRFVVQTDKLPWEHDLIFKTSHTIYFFNFLIRSNGAMKCYVRFIDRSYRSNEAYYTIALESVSRIIHEGKVKRHTAECKMEELYDLCFNGSEIRSIIESTMSFAFKFSLYNYE